MPTKPLQERIEQAHKKLVVPMQKIDRNKKIDTNFTHDVALMAINTEKLLVPVLRILQKKYKKGTYDSTLALLAWHHVAKAAIKEYKHRFGADYVNVNRYELIAIAEDIRDQVEQAKWHTETWTGGNNE